MKRILRIFSYIAGAVAVLIALLLFYLNVLLPDAGPVPDLQVEQTPERVERGRYLANHVMLCMDCHAVRDFSLFTGPAIPETLGAGGERFDHSIGIPGVFYSHNITPFNLKNWTDGEIFHMITTGINRDGKAAFPVMPYPSYGKIDAEDVQAVVAYLRTLEPIETERQTPKADFPINLLMNTFPKEPDLNSRPPKEDRIAYGRYMTTAAACGDCHTRREGPNFVGEPFAGGQEFLFPDGSVVRSANLTPHETGLGRWTREAFIQRFKGFDPAVYKPHPVQPGEFQTIMPWMMYAGMTEEDLGAIFDYLQSLDPVESSIVRFTSGSATE